LNAGAPASGRTVLLWSVAVYLAGVAVARLFHIDVWPYLGVPSGPSAFFDARNLTAALECHRLGIDPLYSNPCDPWNRPLMYLRPWLALGVLGLDQSHTVALAVVLIAAMFLTLAAVVGSVPAGTGVVFAIAACSPAVMFAVERTNMDVALFSLVAAAVLVWRRSRRIGPVISPLLVLAAATAKLYPVVALPAFVLTGDRRAARTALLCLALFGVYVVATLDDVRHVGQIATQGEEYSYGARILVAHVYHLVGADRWQASSVLKQMLAMIPAAFAAAAIIVGVRRRCEVFRPDGRDTMLAFYLGALLYMGTFLAANNFDYRLVFLLFTLPQLTAWCRNGSNPLSWLAAPTLVTVLLALWVGSLSRPLHLWDELVSWCLAGLLAALLTATTPPVMSIVGTVIGRGTVRGEGG
jgi:hypothetical protein